MAKRSCATAKSSIAEIALPNHGAPQAGRLSSVRAGWPAAMGSAMEISISEPAARGVKRHELRLIFASSFGGLLEWYDFYIYAALAGTFGTLFFPSGNETA